MKIKWAYYLFILACCVLVFSCSVRNNYKTLSFFFDGVPNPADSAMILGPSVINNISDSLKIENDTLAATFSKVIYHDPYQFKGCNNCHDEKSVGRMIFDQPDLCYQCHINFSETFSFVHGPAEGGFCTTCHNPHSSKEKGLLNDMVNNLCFYCHQVEELSEIAMHREGKDFLCTDCHNPHGGDNRLMLIK